MADLPKLTPVSESRLLTASEMRCILGPIDPAVADAEARCRAGDVSVIPIIQNLLEQGTIAQEFHTCLVEAVRSGSTHLVHQLLSFGVTVDVRSIRIAITDKALNILSLFVRYGWDINEHLEWCRPSPLSLAVGPNVDIDEEVVSWFLANGANPDKPCGVDMTPLSVAVQYAPRHIILKLLESSGRARNGQLLHHAAHRILDDCGEICLLILERCEFGVNDIMYQNHAFSFESWKVVGLGTPLHECARAGRPETARVLLDHGADLTALNSDGKLALDVARDAGNELMAQFLAKSLAIKSSL
ncbi:hypothetical protein AC578_5486 [Pseudocercospora eumusae]|uniref:Ankyrin n=1 Tax=Pseudocercospora eumusae TaxID=321146 RepID=A0A139H1F9_9PEZI|nr:hypothetical protein AC578_5486 [Pseudocercospora eumusae]